MRLVCLILIVCTCSTAALAAGFPDIATPLRTGRSASHDAAVIISVEDYHKSIGSNVPYAHRDGDAVESHLLYTRGVPSDRIVRLRGASCIKLRAEVRKAAERVGSQGTLWIYFAGHGAQSDGKHMLVCDDARSDEYFLDKAVGVGELQTTAAGSKAAQAVVMIDACFGALGRDGRKKAKGRFGAAAQYVARPKVVVWSATQQGERADVLAGAKHGAFTYLALGALRGWADGEISGKRDGVVTLREAQAYVKRGLRTVQMAGQTPVTKGPAGALGWTLASGVEEASPELRAARRSMVTLTGSVRVHLGDGDIDDLARKAAEAEAAEREARRIREEFEQACEARRDAAAEQVKAAAARHLRKVRPFIERSRPEGRAALQAFVKRYADAKVSCGGVERAVLIKGLAAVRAALGVEATRFRPGLVPIRAGTFEMVSAAGRGPRQTVELSAFEVMATEVTQGQYAALMGKNPSRFKTCGKRCPVERVSWYDAVLYANALSETEGLSICYAIEGESVTWKAGCAGYRLPTRAEWEYAAHTDDGVRNGTINGIAYVTRPVGENGANAWGLHDMLDNVWEWCWDRQEGRALRNLRGPATGSDHVIRDPRGPATGSDHVIRDPRGPAAGGGRVIRGGSVSPLSMLMQAVSENAFEPGFRWCGLGFRLVRRPQAH